MTKFLHFNIASILPAKATTKFKKLWQSRTVAVDPLSADIVKATAKSFLENGGSDQILNLNVGVTFLSLKDNYVKAEGRKEATSKMKVVTLNIDGVTVTKTHIFVHLAVFNGLRLSLRTNKKSGFTTVTGELAVTEEK